MFFGGRGSLIGLDIGTSEVKMLELRRHSSGQLIIYGFSTSRVNTPDETRFAIKEALRHGGFKSKQVSTSVSGRSVIVRYVTMLQMTKEDLENAIRYEADKYIPFEVEEVELACHILEENIGRSDGDQPEMRVLLVAVKRNLIDEHVDLLKDCSLQPTVVDVDAFALSNAFELRNRNLGVMPGDDVVALIDIGAHKTNINILKGETSFFTREVYLAGNDFTEAVARRLGIEESEAEALKIDPQDRASEIEECILPALDDLSNEIQLSFDYFENQFDREVKEVFISGGSASLPGLVRAFETTLDKPVNPWDPIENMAVAGDRVDVQALQGKAGSLAICVGLAARVLHL